ncbi:MAG: hypothetical protein AB7P69_16415 [Candidatus Binatia bacterium]
MKDRLFSRRREVNLAVVALLLLAPLSTVAQETAPTQQEKPAGKEGAPAMRGKHKAGMMAKMHQRHEQMEKMQQEMTQELETQITALREHAKAMDSLTDEKQLLGEMKKHQRMTDAVLETLLKQRQQMHEQRKAHQEQMRSRKGKNQPSEGSGTE